MSAGGSAATLAAPGAREPGFSGPARCAERFPWLGAAAGVLDSGAVGRCETFCVRKQVGSYGGACQFCKEGRPRKLDDCCCVVLWTRAALVAHLRLDSSCRRLLAELHYFRESGGYTLLVGLFFPCSVAEAWVCFLLCHKSVPEGGHCIKSLKEELGCR